MKYILKIEYKNIWRHTFLIMHPGYNENSIQKWTKEDCIPLVTKSYRSITHTSIAFKVCNVLPAKLSEKKKNIHSLNN